jgi:acetyl esterase
MRGRFTTADADRNVKEDVVPKHPDVDAVLKLVGANGPDPILPGDASSEEQKRALAALRITPARPVADDDPVSSKDETTEGGVTLRVYRDAGTAPFSPVVVFMHGGGWVLGDLDMHDHVCRKLARGTGLGVVSVDYRLAPEHPFPAATTDCEEALDWVVAHADDLGADVSRIIALGSSAGANLAAALALQERATGRNRLALQVLAYPVTDSSQSSTSYLENATGNFLTARQMAWFWDCYVPDAAERTNPLASPLHAENLEGVARAIVLTAEYDVLRDEGESYAQALSAAGVDVEYIPSPGMIHGFLGMAPAITSAEPALEDIISRIHRLLPTAH